MCTMKCFHQCTVYKMYFLHHVITASPCTCLSWGGINISHVFSKCRRCTELCNQLWILAYGKVASWPRKQFRCLNSNKWCKMTVDSWILGPELSCIFFFGLLPVTWQQPTTGVGKCPFLGILNITFKYLLEIISPIVGWCSIGTFTNPCTSRTKRRPCTLRCSADFKRWGARKFRPSRRSVKPKALLVDELWTRPCHLFWRGLWKVMDTDYSCGNYYQPTNRSSMIYG